MAEEEFYIPKPRSEIFTSFREKKEDRYVEPNQRVFIIERVEYPDGVAGLSGYCDDCKKRFPEGSGILIHRQGQIFPTRGFPFGEACYANDVMKRDLIGSIRILSSWIFLPTAILLVFLPKKTVTAQLEKILSQFARKTVFLLEPYTLKDGYWKPISSEIGKWVYHFLRCLGISDLTARQIAILPQYFLEYDDAYALRAEDTFSETNSIDLWLHPRQELKRIFDIAIKREGQQGEEIKNKIRSIVNVASFLLLSPWVKQAFRTSLDMLDFRKLQLDETDRYACLIWGEGYDFFDTPHKERLKLLEKEYGGKVPDLAYINKA